MDAFDDRDAADTFGELVGIALATLEDRQRQKHRDPGRDPVSGDVA